MERVNFNKSAEDLNAKERNASENLIRLRDYIRFFLDDPIIVKRLSKERQEDIDETLKTFIRQYNTMLRENERLKSTDIQLIRLEKALRCLRLC